MGGEDSDIPVLGRHSSQQHKKTEAEHTHESNYSDASQTEDDLVWSWSPGDGICPSTEEFKHCCQLKFQYWNDAASTLVRGSGTFEYYLQGFLGLLKDVPPFFNSPPDGVNSAGAPRSYLVMRSSMQVQTTADPDCEQPFKSINYVQCLGTPKPMIYETTLETQIQATIPISGNPLRSGYLTNIVLAWSYIISCRWAEIIQQAGWTAQIFQVKDAQINHSFWEIVIQGYWVAEIKRPKGIFYPPWMLRGEGAPKKRSDWTSVPPDSSLSFDILLDYCESEGIQGELLTGLASVLMLTTRNAPPKFAPPITVSGPLTRPSSAQQNPIFLQLFRSIDKCLFLSSTQDALDSLICSAFFDPAIPCNFLGAASLGARRALFDNQQLLNAIANVKPHLTFFWAAVICSDQASSFMSLAHSSLPPICLVAAFWTNTSQSFLQVPYCSKGPDESVVLRADEFQTSYFCRDISTPWSPAPPFGSTSVDNLSLEVRAHLAHMHRPISWRIYWILKSGERVPASPEHRLRVIKVYDMYRPSFIEQLNEPPDPEQEVADEQSGAATSRLFNWHRGYDDGIWLDDGTRT